MYFVFRYFFDSPINGGYFHVCSCFSEKEAILIRDTLNRSMPRRSRKYFHYCYRKEVDPDNYQPVEYLHCSDSIDDLPF